MQCGNKTEQCPNCGKYIRRAIFTYHYENNCSNLDESKDEMNRPAVENNNISVPPKVPPRKSSPPIQQPTTTTTTTTIRSASGNVALFIKSLSPNFMIQ